MNINIIKFKYAHIFEYRILAQKPFALNIITIFGGHKHERICT
jgi:hypothetical protein